ncbi:hypothetical protein [Marinobacter sp. MBR-99]|uniref:hypothetical protein n=1 Tax=Marinobacter sp. MBR-99 TaxID=3156461 RepID=UPI0033981E1E
MHIKQLGRAHVERDHLARLIEGQGGRCVVMPRSGQVIADYAEIFRHRGGSYHHAVLTPPCPDE